MGKPSILVVGGMNRELVLRGCDAPSSCDQPVVGGDYRWFVRGKGSNQAFAAAKLGAEVTMVGRVGRDDDGDRLLGALNRAGVNTDCIIQDDEAQTGLILTLETSDGNATRYATTGTNHRVSVDDVRRAMDARKFDMLVLQLEVPLETVCGAVDLAKARDIPAFLDAGPARDIPLDRLKGLTILSPNEAEAEALTGISVATKEGAIQAAKRLYESAEPRYVVLKLGTRGALMYDGTQAMFINGFKVDETDPTGAGNTFAACLAIQVCEDRSMDEAVMIAHAAAGICVSREGVLDAVPTMDEVKRFLEERVGYVF